MKKSYANFMLFSGLFLATACLPRAMTDGGGSSDGGSQLHMSLPDDAAFNAPPDKLALLERYEFKVEPTDSAQTTCKPSSYSGNRKEAASSTGFKELKATIIQGCAYMVTAKILGPLGVIKDGEALFEGKEALSVEQSKLPSPSVTVVLNVTDAGKEAGFAPGSSATTTPPAGTTDVSINVQVGGQNQVGQTQPPIASNTSLEVVLSKMGLDACSIGVALISCAQLDSTKNPNIVQSPIGILQWTLTFAGNQNSINVLFSNAKDKDEAKSRLDGSGKLSKALKLVNFSGPLNSVVTATFSP